MAYVSVPKDLTKVKNKIVLNLTKRQIICILIAAMLGVPFYFATRNLIGTSNAATGMVLLMLPAFFFALYEKDGMHLEQILMNVIRVRFLRPGVRKYETENLYEKKPPIKASKVKKGVAKKSGPKKSVIKRSASKKTIARKGGNSRVKKG